MCRENKGAKNVFLFCLIDLSGVTNCMDVVVEVLCTLLLFRFWCTLGCFSAVLMKKH